MTYNIHKGIGGIDRRYRLERIIETIADYDPDLALLQEVDDGVPRSRLQRQVDVLAEALGYRHTAFQSNVKLRKGSYGNAILSRFPLSDEHNVELKLKLKKNRRALGAHCHVRDGSVHRTLLIYNTHLGLAGFERRIQLRRIVRNEVLQRSRFETPVIIAGDFNDVWGTLGRRILGSANFVSATRSTRTFPAAMPLRPLDRIYYRGDLRLDHAFAGRKKVARRASDHLPLIADFEFVAE